MTSNTTRTDLAPIKAPIKGKIWPCKLKSLKNMMFWAGCGLRGAVPGPPGWERGAGIGNKRSGNEFKHFFVEN